MDPETAADSFARRLRESARKERAVKEQAYLKSDLQHLRASVPQIRAAARDTPPEPVLYYSPDGQTFYEVVLDS